MRNGKSLLGSWLVVLLSVPALLWLSGCALVATEAGPANGTSFSGTVMGGQQALSSAKIYLYAASNAGYGQQATSLLLSTGSNTVSDGVNYYVSTSAGGAFSLSSDWNCTAGTNVYLLAVGGNPGLTAANTDAMLMLALGNCSNILSTQKVVINEATTVAAVYALSGFMSSPTQVSSNSTTASKAGLSNAFLTAANLVNSATGVAYTTTPGSGTVTGTVPQANIYTLADILASCENSAGGSYNDGSNCGTLFFNATPSGGTAPTNVVQAALDIAQNAGMSATNIGNLYGLIPSTPPFQPYLTAQPYDWTMPVVFSGGGMSNLYDIAIDGNNNVWAISDGTNGNCAGLTASTGSNVVKLSNLGVALSGTAGYTATDISCPFGLAIDTSNNAWVTSDFVKYITKVNNSTGATTSYTNSGLSYSNNLAFDANGYLWVSNYSNANFSRYYPTGNTWNSYTGGGVTTSTGGISWGVAADGHGHMFLVSDASTGRVAEFNATTGTAGTAVASSGITGGGMAYPLRAAVDQGSNVWVANFGSSAVTAPGTTISELTYNAAGAATPVTSAFSGGGLDAPFGIAVDGGNHIWVADAAAYGVSEFDDNGNALSPFYGFIGTIESPTTAAMYFPEALAIDESGNVWVANYGVNNSSGSTATVQATITELVGAGTPTLTPIAAATAAGTPAAKP